MRRREHAELPALDRLTDGDEPLITIDSLTCSWHERVVKPDGTEEIRYRTFTTARGRLVAGVKIVVVVTTIVVLMARPDLAGVVKEILAVWFRSG